ncbi:tetraspanin-3-like [Haliotis cracherodii]|uniref:tetraspanin-3-like n=1 Tax=Haliotis cracherodii TaxID=6455 RepID=UPI0039E8C666
MAGGCTVTSKICLVVVGLIFWGAAATLCFIGAWVYSTYSHFDEVTEASLTLVPASIIISGGIFMFIIGLLGCIAACKENKCLLAAFFSLILLVFLAEVVAATMGYVFRNDVRDVLDTGLKDAVNHYNETAEKNQIDYIQKELKCCGVHNASDWATSPGWGNTTMVPRSCCKNATNCSPSLKGTDIYDEGCLDLLKDKFLMNLVYIAAVTVAFAIIQILGLISACILLCRSRDVRYETLESAQRNGLRV